MKLDLVRLARLAGLRVVIDCERNGDRKSKNNEKLSYLH